MNAAPDLDRRLVVQAPTARDAEIVRSILAPGGVAIAFAPSLAAVFSEIQLGAGAALVPEEALASDAGDALARFLRDQPPWSDLPILVLTRPGVDSIELADAVRRFGNVTLIERPVRIATLQSAVTTALRARERQYQIRGHLLARTEAANALQAADQRKDEFLATLGHELRNPLAPLLTGLHLLQMNAPKNAVAQRACAVMERQISHLVRLVDDLLEVSRITRGVIEVQRVPLDLRAVVQAAVETSRPAISAASHTLDVDLPPEPLPISGDPVRLTQVFANLLNNAAKYTNSGGHIHISARAEGAEAVVRVRDDGIGIDPGHLSSVFDMFTQVDRADRRTQGGLGIGLTLVRSLVVMHGGTVTARSAGLNAGSEFEVRLPRAAAEAAPTPERFSRGTPVPARRILVVDDNRDAGETLATLLEELGATVAVAYSGVEAIERVESFAPEVVLLDIGMPGMDGYEVARRIRAAGKHDELLLIALTGWGQERDRRRSRAAGIDHHMVKPPDVGKLVDLLRASGTAAPASDKPGGK